MYIIYKYTNIINGKSYIGKTNNPRARHKFHSKADGSSPHFHAAISKYKFESFEKQVLMENIPTNEMACAWEEHGNNYHDQPSTVSAYLIREQD